LPPPPSPVTNATHDLELLYRTHAPVAFRRARRLLGSEPDAREVVHDVFLSLFERPGQYGGHSTVTTFLYSAITHACLNRLRNDRTRVRLLREHIPLPPRSNVAWDSEISVTLRATLERMPQPLAQVAVYYYMDELTRDEIAQLLCCSLRHVGHLIQRITRWTSTQEQLP
jgi:RNA polymerase sigma factor (sigma-70 family)